MPTVDLDDVSLYYEERGAGSPVLLIAGIPAIVSDWATVMAALADTGRRAIAFDSRGSGDSSVPPGPYSTPAMARDALALLDHLAIERANVFGISMGGMIAQELALTAPGRVARLVLGCTQASTADGIPPRKEVGRAFALQTDDWPLRMRTLAPFAFARNVDPDLLERFIAKKSRDVQDPRGYRAQIEAVLAHDARARLPRIDSPTLVITGDDDQIIPAANSELLAARIPQATLQVIAGCGHLFFLERPDLTMQALGAFLAGRA